jgi:antirestriction protein ArdC
VTDQILAELEKGATPWIKPWRVDATADKNVISQKPYQGINRLLLGLSSMRSGFDVPVWASFKQWQSLGASVRKGEKGTQVIFYSPVTKENASTGETETYQCIRAYWVFNARQVDGIEIAPQNVVDDTFSAIEHAEAIISRTGAIITHGGDAAFYAPSVDRIQLPHKTSFHSEASYYATAFHELTHWSGHESRCNRVLKNRFGDSKYAFEELVAEMGAAFLCADNRIQGELRHAGYIGHWVKCLKDDSRAIFKAAALAQKAVDFINAAECVALPLAA